ncbi:MAG: hypothetical protein ACM3XM_17105 [Mycobacterium leprae]
MAAPTEAETILPPAGEVLNYHLSDEGQTVAEFFVRDGERLTGTKNGKPYVTWFITDQGVFRQDAHGTVLLRYLPAKLAAGSAWRQRGSSGADVWFRLEQGPCVQVIRTAASCWELTVLNGSVRSRFQFAKGLGIVWAAGEDLTNPAAGFEKGLVNGDKSPPPDPQAIVKQMPARPNGPLPQVTAVDVAAFNAVERSLLAKAGWLLEADLDNDGQLERVEGKLDVWTPGPLGVYDHDGSRLPDASLDPGRMQKLSVAAVTGMDRPALILQTGRPDNWHQVIPRWLDPPRYRTVSGWQPRIDAMWAGDARVEPDGTLVFTGLPQRMGGYQWSKSFRVQRVGDQYRPEPVDERMTAGAYPITPDDLLTAAFIARWWDLKEDLARYLPDVAVRDAFWAAKLSRPAYSPEEAQTGQISYRESNGYPTIKAAAPVPEGASTEFLVWVSGYEGGTYYAGTVRFGRAADGRLIITALAIAKSAFCYETCEPR